MNLPRCRKTVGLQLDPHGHGIRLRLAHAFACLIELRQDAKKVLHMVADLMRDHIGIAKSPPSRELGLHLVEEIRVEIDLAIGRTIEGPTAALASPQAEFQRPEYMTSLGARNSCPWIRKCRSRVFRIGQHLRDKFLHVIVLRGVAGRILRLAVA